MHVKVKRAKMMYSLGAEQAFSRCECPEYFYECRLRATSFYKYFSFGIPDVQKQTRVAHLNWSHSTARLPCHHTHRYTWTRLASRDVFCLVVL